MQCIRRFRYNHKSYTKQYLQGVIDAFSHGSGSTHIHMRVVVKYLFADVGEFLSQ